MGVGDRHIARVRNESDRIAKMPKQGDDDDDDLIFETATPEVPIKVPPEALRSRTATRHDPLTTELLAEVSRRSLTLDLGPDQVEEAQQHEPEPAPTTAVAATGTRKR